MNPWWSFEHGVLMFLNYAFNRIDRSRKRERRSCMNECSCMYNHDNSPALSREVNQLSHRHPDKDSQLVAHAERKYSTVIRVSPGYGFEPFVPESIFSWLLCWYVEKYWCLHETNMRPYEKLIYITIQTIIELWSRSRIITVTYIPLKAPWWQMVFPFFHRPDHWHCKVKNKIIQTDSTWIQRPITTLFDKIKIQAQRWAAAGRSRHKIHGVIQY